MTDTQPLPTNPAADQANKIIKAIENVLVPIAENAIIAAVPTLGLPVVKQITEAIETALADKLTQLAETGVTFTIIDIQTGRENSAMSDAVKKLLAAQRSGDPNAIAQAQADFEKAQDALVHDDGSSKPQ